MQGVNGGHGKAAQSLGLNYEIEKVTDLEHMIGLGVMATPALAVHGAGDPWGRVADLQREMIAPVLTGGASPGRFISLIGET